MVLFLLEARPSGYLPRCCAWAPTNEGAGCLESGRLVTLEGEILVWTNHILLSWTCDGCLQQSLRLLAGPG
jgi:hypothetical protein